MTAALLRPEANMGAVNIVLLVVLTVASYFLATWLIKRQRQLVHEAQTPRARWISDMADTLQREMPTLTRQEAEQEAERAKVHQEQFEGR